MLALVMIRKHGMPRIVSGEVGADSERVFQKNTAPLLLAAVRMLVCDDACVWGRPVEGLAEDGEGSLKSLSNCMVTIWVQRA